MGQQRLEMPVIEQALDRAGLIFKFIIFNRGADWVTTRPKISWLFVLSATKKFID